MHLFKHHYQEPVNKHMHLFKHHYQEPVQQSKVSDSNSIQQR